MSEYQAKNLMMVVSQLNKAGRKPRTYWYFKNTALDAKVKAMILKDIRKKFPKITHLDIIVQTSGGFLITPKKGEIVYKISE